MRAIGSVRSADTLWQVAMVAGSHNAYPMGEPAILRQEVSLWCVSSRMNEQQR
jgi:hypothetical protein